MLIDAAARAAMRTQIENRIASHPAKNIETARSMILKHAEALKKDEHFSNNLEALKIRVLWDVIYIFVTSQYICSTLYKIPGCLGDHIETAAKKVFKEMGLLDLADLETL
jgi:hypothetical protein